MTDYHHWLPIESRQPPHDRVVVGKVPVAGQRRVLGEQRVNVIFAMRPFGVPRYLAFAPGCQAFVKFFQQVRRFFVQRSDLVGNVHFLVLPRKGA